MRCEVYEKSQESYESFGRIYGFPGELLMLELAAVFSALNNKGRRASKRSVYSDYLIF